MIIYLVIFIICFVILIISIYNQKQTIIHLESVLQYYKWNSAIYNVPPHTGKYLIQTKTREIKIAYYNKDTIQWDIDNSNIVAWCHLPNYLHPESEW